MPEAASVRTSQCGDTALIGGLVFEQPLERAVASNRISGQADRIRVIQVEEHLIVRFEHGADLIVVQFESSRSLDGKKGRLRNAVLGQRIVAQEDGQQFLRLSVERERLCIDCRQSG